MQATSSFGDLEQARSPGGDILMESAVSSPEGMGFSIFDQDVEMSAPSPKVQSMDQGRTRMEPGTWQSQQSQPGTHQQSHPGTHQQSHPGTHQHSHPSTQQHQDSLNNAIQQCVQVQNTPPQVHPVITQENFQGSSIQGSGPQESNFQGINPQGSNLQGLNLQGMNPQGINPQGLNPQDVTIPGGITFNTGSLDSNQQAVQNLLGQLLGNPLLHQGVQPGTHLFQAPDGTLQVINTNGGTMLQNLPQGTNNITLTSDTNTAPITTPFVLHQPNPPGPTQQVLFNPNTILLNSGAPALQPQTIILNPLGVTNQPNGVQGNNTTIFVTPSNVGSANIGNPTFLTSINGTPIQAGTVDPGNGGSGTTVLIAPGVGGDPSTIVLQPQQQQENNSIVPTGVATTATTIMPPPAPVKSLNSGSSRRSLGKSSSQKTVQELLKEEDKRRVQVESTSLDIQKTRDALALRLKLRRPRNELVNQGIIPSTAFKSSPAFHEQLQRLERAKVEDHLQKKMRMRPDKAQLVHQHILEDTNLDPMVNARQQMLKRARIEQDLDIKIKNRPGPLELIEDNILKPETQVEQLVKDGALRFMKTAVAGDNSPYTFYDTADTGSDEALSPPQPDTSTSDTRPSSVTSIPSPSDSLFFSSSHHKVRTLSGSSLNSPNKAVSSTLSGMTIKQEHGVISPPISAGHSPFSILSSSAPSSSSSSSSKGSSSSNRNHRKKQTKRAKPKEIKFHEYKPPNEQGSKAGNQPTLGNPYNLLLMQQQLYLQLQLLQQQQQVVPEHPPAPAYTPPSISNISNNPTCNMVLSPGATQPSPIQQPPPPSQYNMNIPVTASPSPSEAKITTTANSNTSSGTNTTSATSTTVAKPFCLANIEDMKVSELKAELKSRGLHVSGTKPQLVQRLRTAELSVKPGSVAGSPDVTSSSTTKVTSSTDIHSSDSLSDCHSNRQSLASPPVSSPEMMRNTEPMSPCSPHFDPSTFQPIKPPSVSSPISNHQPMSFHHPSSLDLKKMDETMIKSPPSTNSFLLKSPPPSVASTIGDGSSCATTDVDMSADFNQLPEMNSNELLKKQQQRIEELQRALQLSQLQLMQQQQHLGSNRVYTQPPPPPPPPPPPLHNSPPTTTDIQQFFPDLKLSSPPTTTKPASNFQGHDFVHTLDQHPKVFNFASPPSNGQPFQFTTKSHPDLRQLRQSANGIITPKSSSVPSSPTEEAILELGSGLARSITTPNFMLPPPNYEEAVRQNNERRQAKIMGSPPPMLPSPSSSAPMMSPGGNSNLSFDDLLEVLVGHGYPAVTTASQKDIEMNHMTTLAPARSSPPPAFSTATSTLSIQRTLQDIVPSPGPMEVDSHDLSMYNHMSPPLGAISGKATSKNRYSIPSMQIDSTDPENSLLSLTVESGSPAENAFPGALSADNDLNWLDLVLPAASTAGPMGGSHTTTGPGPSVVEDMSSSISQFNKDPFGLTLADLSEMSTTTDFHHLDVDVWDNIQVTE